jgi:hypothetical protein
MRRDTYDMLARLEQLGISRDDAASLRRISMTLHRWHELECGNSDEYKSYVLVRGHKANGSFEHDDSGKPYIEAHRHNPYPGQAAVAYWAVPDRERGALKRLAAIMARYPALKPYVQGDPRGASLYILGPGDVPEGGDPNSYYSRGIAVYK